jgi:hypothetical protein
MTAQVTAQVAGHVLLFCQEPTIPEKPRSRMRRYGRGEVGMAVMTDKTTDQGPGRGGDRHA